MNKQDILKAVETQVNKPVEELAYFINETQNRYMKETDPDLKEELYDSLVDYGHIFISVRA